MVNDISYDVLVIDTFATKIDNPLHKARDHVVIHFNVSWLLRVGCFLSVNSLNLLLKDQTPKVEVMMINLNGGRLELIGVPNGV